MTIYHNPLLALRKPAATVRFPRLIYIGVTFCLVNMYDWAIILILLRIFE